MTIHLMIYFKVCLLLKHPFFCTCSAFALPVTLEQEQSHKQLRICSFWTPYLMCNVSIFLSSLVKKNLYIVVSSQK